MSKNASDDDNKSLRFDLSKVIEQGLSDACMFVINVGRTFCSFLFSSRFPPSISQAARGRIDTAWDSADLYTRPLTYASVMVFLGIACALIESPDPSQSKESVQNAANSLGVLYDWMLAGLEKGSVLGVLQAMVPVLFYLVLFTVGFYLMALLFRQRLSFASALTVTGYALGTFFGLWLVSFTLRSLGRAIDASRQEYNPFWHYIPYFVFQAGHIVRRVMQFLLLLWIMWRSIVLLRELGPFSLRRSVIVFVGGVAFVQVTLWFGSIILAHR